MSAPQPPGPAPAELQCPRCAATIAPEQDWCLECGAPARTRLAQTPNWRMPVAAVAAIVLLAGAALAIAFAELTDDDAPVTTPATQTAPGGVGTQTVPPGVSGDPSATQTAVPELTTPTPTAPTVPPAQTVPTVPPTATTPTVPTIPPAQTTQTVPSVPPLPGQTQP